MREIKFRVWDGSKLHYPEKETLMMDLCGKLCVYPTSERQKCILMQYTGLHDKNGKEIYEGDIVLAMTENTRYQWVVKYDEFICAFVVNRSLGKGDSTFGTFEHINHVHDRNNGIEVIGNIYENPDLLMNQQANGEYLRDWDFNGSMRCEHCGKLTVPYNLRLVAERGMICDDCV